MLNPAHCKIQNLTQLIRRIEPQITERQKLAFLELYIDINKEDSLHVAKSTGLNQNLLNPALNLPHRPRI